MSMVVVYRGGLGVGVRGQELWGCWSGGHGRWATRSSMAGRPINRARMTSGTRLALTSRSSCTRLSARDAPSDAAAEVTSRYDVTLRSNDVIPCVETFGCAAQSRNSAGVALMLIVVKWFN